MKRNSSLVSNLCLFAFALFVITLLSQGCKEPTHEVIPTSCADNKPDTTDFTQGLNKINHAISLERAKELTENYARYKDSILSGAYGKDSVMPDYETFNLQSIDSLMCQEATVGFRIYLGLDENKKIRFVLAGVDANGNDILQLSKKQRDNAGIGNEGMRTTASAPPPPPPVQNNLLLEEGQRHP